MKKYYYIYKITFLKGSMKGKYYIGKHVSRTRDLVNDGYFGSGTYCKSYYKKYKPILGKTIMKDIIEICNTHDELLQKEKYYIGDLYKTDSNCVNLKAGGLNYEMQECTKNKISKKLMGHKGHRLGLKNTEEHNNKISIANTGKKHTEEAKQKMSDALKGRTAWNKGSHLSEEHKRKISIAGKGRECPTKGRHLSEEHKRKISIAGKGRIISLETKAKMSINMTKRNKGNTITKGRKWINNGIQNKMIKPELLEQYLFECWQLGRIKKAAKQAA